MPLGIPVSLSYSPIALKNFAPLPTEELCSEMTFLRPA